ncbi:Isoleucine--tRNA ligase cytoplasmic [Bienertia sinuspersici]
MNKRRFTDEQVKSLSLRRKCRWLDSLGCNLDRLLFGSKISVLVISLSNLKRDYSNLKSNDEKGNGIIKMEEVEEMPALSMEG